MYQKYIKRLIDIILSACGIIVLAIPMLLIALAVKLDSKGPVFYRQERVTQYGKTFRIHKFRTMVQNADKGSQVTVNNDSRITRVGKLIRNCRLDEIAQLIDVIQGTLTLCGVRPESPKYVAEYTPEMMATLLLPAGITCEASVRYKDESRLLDNAEDADAVYVNEVMPGKMRYNLRAILAFSFWGDIKIMFMTVFAMFGKDYSQE